MRGLIRGTCGQAPHGSRRTETADHGVEATAPADLLGHVRPTSEIAGSDGKNHGRSTGDYSVWATFPDTPGDVRATP